MHLLLQALITYLVYYKRSKDTRIIIRYIIDSNYVLK